MEAFGHTTDDGRPWEPLTAHLQAVANRAEQFASAFGAGEWGRLAGLWHDLGKFSSEFQNYLRGADSAGAHLEGTSKKKAGGPSRVDHSTAGAQWADERGRFGRLLAYALAGHHAGLPDWDDTHRSGLGPRLNNDNIPPWQSNADDLSLSLSLPPPLRFQGPKPEDAAHAAYRVSFWIRMLFSCLVDADRLATEAFANPEQAQLRPASLPALSDLAARLESHLSHLAETAADTPVNRQRRVVLRECLEASSEAPGFFSLCVPTGGGKTFSSMAFALAHAERHDLRRVVVAVPYTSIIEQNAEAYRQVFGEDVVLEHHSNLDPDEVTPESLLQTENWDATVIVTTTVQLFESLFAARTGRCRKLHRLVRSVIVLDEAQSIPVDLLQPTLWALRELVEVYGCSIVLCSATQPAVDWREDFAIGLRDVRPITKDPEALHRSLGRTRVERAGVIGREELVARLLAEPQVLCIVNTKRDAASIFRDLGKADGQYHLSTSMCAAHRLEVLTQVRQRLVEGRDCRVVSTQLVEAGVDLDFPTVFRAVCGLDSLTQAAGRCNREGRLDCGRVVWFQTEELPPPGSLRQGADTALELAAELDDLLAPVSIEQFFRHHFWLRKDEWDKHRVLAASGDQPEGMRFQFREMAQRYRLIREDTTPIIVPYGEIGHELVEELHRSAAHPDWRLWRRLQRYTVQVREYEKDRLLDAGLLVEVIDRYVLAWGHSYDSSLGLLMDGGRPAAEDLTV
ncbi:MAG: CRISPR-associated endonuclease Cas3'' [Deltaproteobacteria bacterium]|nr:MAG: CRISPR-associated endonuclease Cas3'' [Deltaproteobacteria bacterium]